MKNIMKMAEDAGGITLTPDMLLYLSLAISNIIRAIVQEATEMTPEELKAAIAVQELRKERLIQRAKEG